MSRTFDSLYCPSPVSSTSHDSICSFPSTNSSLPIQATSFLGIGLGPAGSTAKNMGSRVKNAPKRDFLSDKDVVISPRGLLLISNDLSQNLDVVLNVPSGVKALTRVLCSKLCSDVTLVDTLVKGSLRMMCIQALLDAWSFHSEFDVYRFKDGGLMWSCQMGECQYRISLRYNTEQDQFRLTNTWDVFLAHQNVPSALNQTQLIQRVSHWAYVPFRCATDLKTNCPRSSNLTHVKILKELSILKKLLATKKDESNLVVLPYHCHWFDGEKGDKKRNKIQKRACDYIIYFEFFGRNGRVESRLVWTNQERDTLWITKYYKINKSKRPKNSNPIQSALKAAGSALMGISSDKKTLAF